MKNYAFVNEKQINGKTYQIWRNIKNPKDEVLLCEGRKTGIKIKEIWQSNAKIKKVKLK